MKPKEVKRLYDNLNIGKREPVVFYVSGGGEIHADALVDFVDADNLIEELKALGLKPCFDCKYVQEEVLVYAKKTAQGIVFSFDTDAVTVQDSLSVVDIADFGGNKALLCGLEATIEIEGSPTAALNRFTKENLIQNTSKDMFVLTDKDYEAVSKAVKHAIDGLPDDSYVSNIVVSENRVYVSYDVTEEVKGNRSEILVSPDEF